ncbi:aminotransferase class IV [Lutimaribacter saemankumensis]|uniref:Probable branched-chain-amino-acid aminotransferase n=1 Tax=Lutimaribacter saemankumensis TaxID=490829 RepID=A0A1G8L858_9RHOB|nr:aminotransferase class IV [Lutimaribacter saemankumensis]SDI51848.1 branched-chain amino acid aminotransferase [Lutimaribacter saemankumensis]
MADLSKGAAWMAGEILPISEAKIGVTDWGLTHSDVTYDVVPVWKGGFFRLDDYLDRFMDSLAAMRLDPGLTRAQMAQALTEMMAASGLQDAYCAMVCARGAPIIPGSRDPRECANHFYAWCVPYVHVIPFDVAEAGASALIPDTPRRIPEDSVNPRAKNYHWGDFTDGLFQAKDAGFNTVILLDHAGNVTEGPGFNAFAIKGDRLITSGHGVLGGITRRTVLEMGAEAGLTCEERPLPLEEFLEADEVFLSSSGGGVTPVVRVNDRVFGNGAPGPRARALRGTYFEWLEAPRFRTEIAYA